MHAEHARESNVTRFERSMILDYEKWHDGIGYDLDAIRQAAPAEKATIETILIRRGIEGWREVEALAEMDTPSARAALRNAIRHRSAEVRMAVMRHAPHLVAEQERSYALVQALEEAEFYGGLTAALLEVEEFHPKPVMDALFRGVLRRDGAVAVHFAAMLTFLHGKATSAFDDSQRSFFVRFNTPDRDARRRLFRQLCEHVGVNPVLYLARHD